MADSLKILFIGAEAAPFAKQGGLGDVVGSLPKALRQLGHDVRVVIPAYANIERGYPGVEPMPGALSVPVRATTLPAGVWQGLLPGSDVPIYFIAERNLFDRPNIYGYHDDAYRFAFFSRAALELTLALDWRPDVIHAHDWHTAPAIAWLANSGWSDPRLYHIPTLFTIHNLAHQGRTSTDIWDYLRVHTGALYEEGYGEVNFMARGIYHATMITTVSPTYGREIMTRDGGAGLSGLLQQRSFDVHGILNGVDYSEWDPAADPRLPTHFDEETLDLRRELRHQLQEGLGLPVVDDIPLVAMITRLDWQKGLQITGEVIHRLLNNWAGEAQFVVLGTGDESFERMLEKFADYHRGKMAAVLKFNARLAPLIYGGADIFLMPSLFEPCGLSQMIAMRYGCVPVVRATGGLEDTIWDGVTGFKFGDFSAESFWQALARAIYVYNVDKPRWRDIQLAGMRTDFSWRRSAAAYDQVYHWALARQGK